jgi:hypothetical protein
MTMKNTIFTFLLVSLIFTNCTAQCDLLKVEIKDSSVLKALKEYVTLARNSNYITQNKGIILLSISKDIDGVERFGVYVTKDNHYKEFQHLYLNYTIIDDVIFLIKNDISQKIIKPSILISDCIEKIVGDKVDIFPKREEYIKTLPSGKQVTQIRDRKMNTFLSGAYLFESNGNYHFKQSL